jgi:putative transposase
MNAVGRKRHHPLHLNMDRTVYFVTARLHRNGPRLDEPEIRRLFLDHLRSKLSNASCILFAWAVLPDHYHILFQGGSGEFLGPLMQAVHGGFSRELNKREGKPGRRMFRNYWDRCVRDRRDFYSHFNYIHQNPVKHGLVRGLADYDCSSYAYWRDRKGERWMDSCFEIFPIADYMVRG